MESVTQDLASRYQFKSLLGEGGAGQVYTAWDKHLRRTVAIKQIKIGQLEGEDVRDTWQEAMCLASVRHSNIVTVYDLGIDGDTPYIVMEYVQGETLERAVERSSLDISTFIDIARQCLDGLCGAHHAGLVHRDLKPANIMLCRLPTGFYQVKILDFGIASFFQDGDQAIEKTDGAICGSIHWISPEQIEGKQATERSDLYSLGCVYYFALTGMPPFSAATREGIIKAHLEHSVMPLEKLRPDLPEPLSKWVMRLMSRDPADRPSRSTLALEEFEIITGRRQVSTNSLPLPPAGAGPSFSPVDSATCSFNFESELADISTAPTAGTQTIPTVEDQPRKKPHTVIAGVLILRVLASVIAGLLALR
jgi:serine/threonine protein kinase